MAGRFSSSVLIAGGGLGGLCLAQGLKKAGIASTVFERDVSPTSRLTGYRLSLTPDGFKALHSCLPEALWKRALATATDQDEGIHFIGPDLSVRFFKQTPAAESESHRWGSISRVSLREILLEGLEDRVHFGKQVEGYEVLAEDTVRLRFSDGTSVEGASLVGADGTHSKIREQLMPESNRIDTGSAAIAAKVPYDAQTKADYDPEPIVESAVVLDKAPQGLFLARHKIETRGMEDNYIFWSFLTPRQRLPQNLGSMSEEALIALVDEMTPGFDERLKRLIRRGVPSSVQRLTYEASIRPKRWPAGPVTVLGDAVHNMPPTGGEGANMALKDGMVLTAALVDHFSNGRPLADVLEDYETEMIEYAFNAVETSLFNLHRMITREKKLG